MIRVREFPPAHERAVRRGLALVHERLAHPPRPIPRDLRAELQAILRGRRPLVDLVYGGAQGVCQKPHARSAGYSILLCRRAFSGRGGEARPAAVLLHELIHIAHGWELDAETFENAFFSAREGARAPTKDDWLIIRQQRYEGWWVRINPRSGRVTDQADRFILYLPVPTSGRPARGRRSPKGRTVRSRAKRRR